MSEKKEKKKAGMLKKPDNFDELEKEFETVLNELLTDESLERFRTEYEKLHEALVDSHESERLLMNKVRDLNNEIAANAEKVATALQLSKEDEATITNLKQESEKAWKMVEYLQEKEVWSRETITSLRCEIDNLNELVEKGADLAMQLQMQEPGGLQSMSMGVGMDVGVSGSPRGGAGYTDQQTVVLDAHAEANRKAMAELEQEHSKLKNDLYQMQVDLRNRTLDLQRERTRRTKAEKELSQKISEVEDQSVTISDLKRQVETVKENMSHNEQAVRELRVSLELSSRENENLSNRLQKFQADVEKQLNQIELLQMENLDLSADLHSKEDKLGKISDNVKKLNKLRDTLTRKVKTLTEQRTALRKERELLTGQLVQAEKTIESSNRAKEVDLKQINNLMRERDVFNKNLIKQVHATEKQANLVSLHEQTNRNMGQEIMGFRREAEKQRRIIVQLERERDRIINENGNLTLKVLKGMEECQVRDLQILDYQKHVEELESRLKIQQNLYEAVHQDRNMYSRQLIETQDEMSEMKNKVRVLEHQSQQLKEEVGAREAAVVKEHLEVIRLEKERDSLLAEIQMLKRQLGEYEQVIVDLRSEEKNLQRVISISDEMIKRQKRELDTLISERDILGSQLVRRNDELSLLYQKVKLLQILIANGNKVYDRRIEDIRLLRLEVRRQRHQNRCLQKTSSMMASMKQELYSVHRQVLQERARCAALENELSHPRQIHRWRGLEITDPSKFELLEKIQGLQKRLISRTEEVVEVERILQEKDRLYLELRVVLERQPGPEVAQQIGSYQRVLRAKNRQLKSLVAEVNMLEVDSRDGEHTEQRLQMEVLEYKKKYYREKKRRLHVQEVKAMRVRPPVHIEGKDQFTGGGFKITQR